MMVLGYLWGQKYYPIPYNLSRALLYVSTALTLFALVQGSMFWIEANSFLGNIIRVFSLLIFVFIAYFKERKLAAQLVKL
jgi:hypothetical protein